MVGVCWEELLLVGLHFPIAHVFLVESFGHFHIGVFFLSEAVDGSEVALGQLSGAGGVCLHLSGLGLWFAHLVPPV